MKTPPTNLVSLKKTRRNPEPGDIFTFQLEQMPDRYYFGRVITTDAKICNLRDFEGVLIYLYRSSSPSKTEIPSLKTTDLLLPPIITNRLPWTRGFFEVMKSCPHHKRDLLTQHCFRDSRGWFFDEYGNRLTEAVEPVGAIGIAGIGAIDDDISQVLGFALK